MYRSLYHRSAAYTWLAKAGIKRNDNSENTEVIEENENDNESVKDNSAHSDDEETDEIDEIMNDMNEANELREKCWEHLSTIKELYNDYPDRRESVGEQLYYKDFAELTVSVYGTIDLMSLDTESTLWTPISDVYEIWMNFSSCSEQFAESMSYTDVMKLMMRNLSLYYDKCSETENQQVYGILLKSIVTLYYIVCQDPSSHGEFQNDEAQKMLEKLMSCNDHWLKSVASFIQIYIEEDEKISERFQNTDVIESVMRWISEDVSSDEHETSEKYNWFKPSTLTDLLTKLAIDDLNKSKMLDLGILKVFINMLNNEKENEQESIADCLLSLVENQSTLQHEDLDSAIEKLEMSENPIVISKVNEIKWMINTHNETTATVSIMNNTVSEGDVDNLERSLTDEEIAEELKDTVKKLKSLNEYQLECIHHLKNICNKYYAYTNARELMGSCLADNDFAAIVMKILWHMTHQGIFSNESIWSAVYYIYHICSTYSRDSEKLAVCLAMHGAVTIMTLNLKHKPYLENIENENELFIIKSSLRTLHNIGICTGVKCFFSDNSTAEAVKPFIGNKSDFLKVTSVLTLAEISEEEDVKELNDEIDIKTILNFLHEALLSEDRIYEDISLFQLIHGLSQLAMIEGNSKKKENLNVCIDYERIENDVLDWMAKAVENAAVVLMCVSEKYSESGNCKMEAEYTKTLGTRFIPLLMQEKYSARGWLGIIIAGKKYYEFTERKDFDTMFKDMLREIKRIPAISKQINKGKL